MKETQSSLNISTKLQRIAKIAKESHGAPLTNLAHHIDIEWDGRRLGTDQVRFYTIDGDTLSLKTEPNKSPVDGREGIGILTFERVKGSGLQ